MARYDKRHKDQTRTRIMETAGRRLKRDGVIGSGVSTLMADAGLTNGAFYAHFASKADLVANVIESQLEAQRAAAVELAPGAAAVELYVRTYLSTAHRDDPSDGCPSAAMLDEIIRCDDTVRQTYTDGVLGVMDVIASWLDIDDAEWSRLLALGAFAGMVGTLQIARAITDPSLSDALLDHGVKTALTQLGIKT
jgi:AcrR family transcriptional regulator